MSGGSSGTQFELLNQSIRLHLPAKLDENGNAGFEFQNLIPFHLGIILLHGLTLDWEAYLAKLWTLSHVSPPLVNLEFA
jgi:hypothetical protein